MPRTLTEYLHSMASRCAYMSRRHRYHRTHRITATCGSAHSRLVVITSWRDGPHSLMRGWSRFLDADKEAFCAARTSLIQTIGRAAAQRRRPVYSLYADHVHRLRWSAAIDETNRRRDKRVSYTPITSHARQSIKRSIRNIISIGYELRHVLVVRLGAGQAAEFRDAAHQSANNFDAVDSPDLETRMRESPAARSRLRHEAAPCATIFQPQRATDLAVTDDPTAKRLPAPAREGLRATPAWSAARATHPAKSTNPISTKWGHRVHHEVAPGTAPTQDATDRAPTLD